MFGFVLVVFAFGWQDKSVAGFVFVALVFGLQGRSVTGVVFVFVGLSFLDFNNVFLKYNFWFSFLFLIFLFS